jgi:hypothetical protein
VAIAPNQAFKAEAVESRRFRLDVVVLELGSRATTAAAVANRRGPPREEESRIIALSLPLIVAGKIAAFTARRSPLMKHAVSFAIASISILLSTASFAADFRVLDFDASCDGLAALETAQGSTPFEGKLPSGYQYAFRNRDMDRDVVIGYSCRDGKFFRGAYIFDVNDGDDATKLYGALKRRVSKELGAPYYDFASAEHRRKMEEVGATLSRTDTQVAFWNAKNSEAHASVAEPSKDRGWRVSLSYTAKSALED